MENEDKDKLESQLAKIKQELRQKERKLKKYTQVLGAKQHVRETIRRQRVASEEQSTSGSCNDESQDLSDGQFKYNQSRTVTFSAEAPEVIFVTPTSNEGSNRREKNHRYYRSLSTQKPKFHNRRTSQKDSTGNEDVYEDEASFEILYDSKYLKQDDKSNGIILSCSTLKDYDENNSAVENVVPFSEPLTPDNAKAFPMLATSPSGVTMANDINESVEQFPKNDVESLKLTQKTVLEDVEKGIYHIEHTGLSNRNKDVHVEPVSTISFSSTRNASDQFMETNVFLCNSVNPKQDDQYIDFFCMNSYSGNLSQSNEDSSIKDDCKITEDKKQVLESGDSLVVPVLRHTVKSHPPKLKHSGNVGSEHSQDLFSTQSKAGKEEEFNRKVYSQRERRQYRASQSSSSEGSSTGTVGQTKTSGWRLNVKLKNFHISSNEPHKQRKCEDMDTDDIMSEELMIKEMEREVMKDANNDDSLSKEIDTTDTTLEDEINYTINAVNSSCGEAKEENVACEAKDTFPDIVEPPELYNNDVNRHLSNVKFKGKKLCKNDLISSNFCSNVPYQNIQILNNTAGLNESCLVPRMCDDRKNKETLNGNTMNQKISCLEFDNIKTAETSVSDKIMKIGNDNGELYTRERIKPSSHDAEENFAITCPRKLLVECNTSSSQCNVSCEEVIGIKNYGRVLTTNIISILCSSATSPVDDEFQPWLLIVQEFGLSVWRKMKTEVWAAVSTAPYPVARSSCVRNVAAVVLKSSVEARFLVISPSNSRDVLHILYAQFNHQERKWLITKTDFSTNLWCVHETPTYCALDDWTIAVFYTHQAPSSPLLIIDFDVTFSSRRKEWDLVCHPYTRSILQDEYLSSLVPLNLPDAEGVVLCKSNAHLYVFDVFSSTRITRLKMQELTPFWAIDHQGLIFMVSKNRESKEICLSALNPVTGNVEDLFSWSCHSERSFCTPTENSTVKVYGSSEPTGVSLHSHVLYISYSDGMVTKVSLE